MNKKIKIVSWITAIAISLTLIGQAQANDRGNRQYNNRNSGVIFTQPQYVIYAGGRHGGQVIILPNNHRHYAKMKYAKKMRKMRRMRRLYARHRFVPPVIYITRDLFR